MQITILRDLSVYWGMFHVILLFVMLFRSRYTRKKTILLACAGMGILMLLNAVGLAIFGMEALGRAFVFTCSAPSFVFFYLLSADKKFRFLFTFCLADTLCMWVMVATNLLDHYLGGGRYILMFVSRLIAFPLLEYCAYRFLRKPYLELQDAVEKGWGIFSGLTMLYYILLVAMVQYPTNIVNRPEDVFSCILVLILMFFTYATIFLSLYGQLQLYRKQQNERILQEQKIALEAQLENQQRIRRMKHDMRAHMITLLGLLAEGKTMEATLYLNNMEAEIDSVRGQFCTNIYLNAVCSYYFQKFQELDTALRLHIKVGDEELPHMELCQILSNGLENAWEASRTLDVKDRGASVQMRYSRDYLIVRIKNRCREDVSVEKGTIPPTSKKGAGHGFGLLTVEEAAKRLDGEMLCYTEDGNFVLDVMVRAKHPAAEATHLGVP